MFNIKLVPSVEQDIERLSRWIKADPYHKDCLNPQWWLTGNGILCFCLQDDIGPVAYVRLDAEDLEGLIRLHTQFAPRDEVLKLRLIKAMLKCVPIVQEFCKQRGGNGIVFQSVNPLLIDFMKRKFGFQPAGDDDYILSLKVGV